MNYLLRSNRPKSDLKKISYRAFIVFVIFLVISGFLRPYLNRAFTPMVSYSSLLRPYVSSVSAYFSNVFMSKYNLEKEVISLNSEISILRDEISLLKNEKKISETWGGIFEDASSTVSKRNLRPFRVVLRPPYTVYDTVVISHNNLDIASGTKAYGLDRLLPIGYVEYSDTSQARIKLFSSPDQKFSLLIGTSTDEWLAEGKGGGVFESVIPKTQDIKRGEAIYLPQESSLQYSVVDSVISRDSDPFQTVRFLLPVSFRSMDLIALHLIK